MKLPLVFTIVILAAGSFWGVRETRVVTQLREKHRRVVQEAAALGVSVDLTKPHAPTKVSKREREDGSRKVKEFANTLVAFAKEMKELEKSGNRPDEATQKRIMEIVEGVLSLNGEELKFLIVELRNRPDLDDDMRKELIGFSIMMLAQEHPQKALAIFTESSDLLDGGMSNHVLSSALTQWAKDQPLAALEWIKANAEKHPDLVKDDAKRAVIAGAALQDFNLAFQLMGELKLSADDNQMFSRMSRAADTPERQIEFLAALRKQAANTADQDERDDFTRAGLGSLFDRVVESGYEESITWIESAQLSDAESKRMVESLNYNDTKADTGKWLDWLSSQSGNGKQSEESTRNLVRNWTENDYQAAGEWLAGSPAGPLKEIATMSYLETVAPYDPEVAAQWAKTLPASKQSDAMKNIYRKLKGKDKATAEEFATSHGIDVKK